LAALDELLASPLPQLAFLKASRARMEAIGAEEALTVYGETAPAVAGALPDLEAGPGAAIAAQAGAQAAEEEALLGDLLRVQLESAGVDWRSPRAAPPSARCPPLCRRWLEVSARILAAQRIEPDALDPWRRWEQAKRGWLVDAGRRARVELAERALRAIPDVLNGRVKATEVLFPGARFELVEGIYRGNAVADYFNAAAAEQVAAYVEARLRHDPQARLRILEVGAGTGSTSAAVLARLEPYAPRLEEYRFTDVSRAFLLRAEAELAPGRPFLRASVFDVGAPVAAQGIEPARYDVAIATSVLHATDDVRRSLRNVKAALRRNGVLVLNELSTTSLFLHVTFGLLEGWWSHLDTPLRIPGSPVLTPEAWRRALEREGFGDVRFPVSAAHGAGQQIVTAASDGVVRQPIPGRAGPAVPAAAARPAATAAPKRPPRPAGGAASGQDRLRERGRAYLKQVVGEVLKVPVERIETSAPLGRYGIDSILIVRLAAALRGVFGEVSTTLLFEHQSIDALVEEFLRTRPGAFAALADAPDAGQPGAGEAPRPPREAVSAPGPVDEPFGRRARAVGGAARRAAPEGGQEGRGREVAIVGLAGRYPRSPDVRAFWRNLREGRSCVSEVPRDRWDWRAYHGDAKGTWGTIYTRWGGFLDDVARFDPAFFHLSPREAAQIDPQERQFLEIAYAAIEDAGYVPAGLSAGGKVGVFVGVTNGHYGSGAAHWSVANRVSFALDFHGPSLAVDTACSSSLTAIHLAVESLRSGTCDCAIAGGVNLIVAPIHYMKLAAAGMLSPGDACRAFGAGADGFVDGEGVGAVVLKPLERALADGDQVYAVIKGSMVNAGGRTHGYTVPNPAAQQAVVAEALRRAGVAARGVSYLEAHGTGTELGDPIEIAGLSRAFAAETGDRGFCAIGSVKGNIGHLESAAGIAGLTKVLLQMKHGQVAPSLHAALPNPKIDFADTPFVVQQALATWRRPRLTVDGEVRTIPLIAGISSFGAGGANAHLVVQELNRPDRAASARGGVGAFVLSARTERDLRAKARQLADFVEAGELGEERLLDAAFTLQVGREPMAERLGLVVTSLQELGEKLAAFSETGESPRGTFRGSVSGREPQRQGDVVETGVPATIPEWERLVEAWVAGAAVDWRRASGARDRVSLPTYPFAGDRYWAPAERSQVAPRLPGSGAVVVASPEGTPPGASRQPQPAADAGSGAPADPARDGGAACDRGPAGRALRAELAESLAKILELRSGDIDVDQEFADMGLDSIIGVEWIRALGAHYGISIRPTAVYDYPSIRAFAGFLEKELVRARPGGPPAEPRVEPRVEPAPGSSESALRDMLLQVKQGTLDVEVADRLVAAIVGCEAQTADGAG
jgi:acyl transferase domain-containing protein